MTGVKKIRFSASSAFALMQDGTVRAWGDDYDYALGDSDSTFSAKSSPIVIPTLSNVIDIADDDHWLTAYALKGDGSVWAWGQFAGADGISQSPIQVPDLSNVVQIAAGHGCAYAVRSDGTVWAWGSRNYSGQLGNGTSGYNQYAPPARIPGLAGVKSVSAADGQVYAVLDDGIVYAWGDDRLFTIEGVVVV